MCTLINVYLLKGPFLFTCQLNQGDLHFQHQQHYLGSCITMDMQMLNVYYKKCLCGFVAAILNATVDWE